MSKLPDMHCSRCSHPGSIFTFFTDTCELVCRTCQHIEREHGPTVSPRVLGALGVLFRVKAQRTAAARLREQTKALIAHDQRLLIEMETA